MKKDKKNILQTGSIRTRLTLFYTLAVFVLLTVIAFFLYWVTINILYKADYEFLADEIDTIQYILENKPIDQVALKQAIEEVPLEPDGSIYRYFIRVFNEKKNVLIETPGMDEILHPGKSIYKSAKLLDRKRYFWYSKGDQDNYLLIESPIRIGSQLGVIQIALDITYQHAVMKDRKKLVAFLLLGTLCSLLVGFLIAHRGLRSLYLLTETVEKIKVKSLNQRIDPKAWPKELRGLSIAFNQMLDRIEASFLRLKQFSADLSHELRTPVTNLIGETEITLSYADSVNEYRESMESNLEELQRISSLIENILFLARAENPQLELQTVPLNINEEIAIVSEFYQAMADEKNIRITYEGSANLHAHADLFRRMISNILSNSLKYTQHGGWVHFKIKEITNAIQIILSDNGMGIAPEHLPKIFDRFYRADAARSQHPGTGLGLAIVKSIIELHRGTISILSKPGQGTIITINLPTS